MATLCAVLAASPLHEKELLRRVEALLKDFRKIVDLQLELRGVVTSAEALSEACKGCEGLLIVVGTGGTEEIVLEGLRGYEGPLLIAAHPYANSLPATLELVAALSEKGRPHYAVFAPELEGHRAASLLNDSLRALSAVSSLKGSRLAIVGEPSSWLVYSRASEADVARLGFKLVKLRLDELYELYLKAEPPREAVTKLSALGLTAPPEALKLYAALKELAARHHLSGLTLECFKVVEQLGVTPCLPLSLLNDEGLPAACEGDVPLLITMVLMSKVFGRAVFMGNPAIIDGNRVLLAHCAAPLSLGRKVELVPHYETRKPVAVAVHVPEGASVVLARLDARLRVLRVAEGRVVFGSPISKDHCRTQVWIELSGPADKILEDSLGNHYALVMAASARPLVAAARMLGLSVEGL